MNKLVSTVAGAAVALTSAILVIDYASKRKKDMDPSAGFLLAGIAGLLIGAALPVATGIVEDHKKMDFDGALDDADTDRVKANISEVLGNSADRGKRPEKLRHIELDEDTSIEDFICPENAM